jgi:hypothetical protein
MAKMTKSLARFILEQRGTEHYPDSDYESAIQSFMDYYDETLHFSEQMKDFVEKHPEFGCWFLLFSIPVPDEWDVAQQIDWYENEAKEGNKEAARIAGELRYEKALAESLDELVRVLNSLIN